MVSYDVRCPFGHVDEVTFRNMGEATHAFTSAEVRCKHTECVDPADANPCGEPVKIVILPRSSGKGMPIIYNAPGFYGNVPTREAHNTRLV